MKIRIGIIAVLIASSSFAQQKETVHSVVVVRHEMSWYKTQLDLWKADVEKNDQDAEAWYNYYSAARAIRNLLYEDEEKQKAYGKQCTSIAESAYAAIPETFEGNHLMYWDLGTKADPKYLSKAYEINPNDPRIFDDMLIQGEVTRDKTKFHDMAVQIYEANELPGGMVNWAYNLLSELEENAIVLAAGDNDTYSLWLAQEALGIRKDVQVINTSLITMSDYQKKLFKEIGLPPFELDEEHTNIDELFERILKNKIGRTGYVSVSAIRQFYEKPIMEELYLTGLAYKYSADSFDNMSLIRRNYEKRFLKDHLYMSFAPHKADERAVHFKGLYLPMLIKLYKHYKVSEEKGKEAQLLELIKKIGEETGQEADVNEQLKGC